MKRSNRAKMWLAALACGGGPLITTATCDPYSGVINVFRDDDHGHFDGFFYEEIIFYDDFGYLDCLFGCW